MYVSPRSCIGRLVIRGGQCNLLTSFSTVSAGAVEGIGLARCCSEGVEGDGYCAGRVPVGFFKFP